MYKIIGKIDFALFQDEYTDITTEEVILMDERALHVKTRHNNDYELYVDYLPSVISDPDEIIKDENKEGTVYFIKFLEEDNINVIVRLALKTDNNNYKNSIITFHRIRNTYLLKLERKNKIVYKKQYSC